MTRTKGKLVRTTCQFPPEYPGDGPHTFEYVKVTKPQVYCEPHRKGWVDDDGRKHGDERRVRVIRDPDGKVIARKLIVEERIPLDKPIPSDVDPSIAPPIPSPIGQLREAGAGWLQALDVPLLGDLQPAAVTPAPSAHGDPFHWQVVEQFEEGGVRVTVEAIVTDAKGRPRFDPKLVRGMTVMGEAEVTPKLGINDEGDAVSIPPLSLDMASEGEDGEEADLHELLPDGQYGEAAPGVRADPDPWLEGRVPAWRGPDVLRRFQFALMDVLVNGRHARRSSRNDAEQARRLYPEEVELAEGQARQHLMVLLTELGDEAPDGLLAALLRGGATEKPPYREVKGGNRRPRSKRNGTRKVNRP